MGRGLRCATIEMVARRADPAVFRNARLVLPVRKASPFLNHWPQDSSESCLSDGRYGRCQEVRPFPVFQKQAREIHTRG